MIHTLYTLRHRHLGDKGILGNGLRSGGGSKHTFNSGRCLENDCTDLIVKRRKLFGRQPEI